MASAAADVFLSYKAEDRARLMPLVAALEAEGFSVWWDAHIGTGADWREDIQSHLDSARCVIVAWSKRSIGPDGRFVRDEASRAVERGVYLPVKIDDVRVPLGFGETQALSLTRWKGDRTDPRFRTLADAVRDCLSGQRSAPAPRKEQSRPLIRWMLLTSATAVLLIFIGAAVWYFSDGIPSVPVVAVAPAESSAQAETLARDLLVKLGSLRSARTDVVRLTASAAGKSPNAQFIFEAAGSNDAKDSQGNLSLLAGKDRAVLWSKDFEIEGGQTALEQSMAYTAGQVLDCALQANAPSQPQLDEDALKLFLNGCALFGDRYFSDPNSVVPIFQQVVAKAPRLEAAWSKLLLAESQELRRQMLFSDHWSTGLLPEHIRAARALNPRLPELYMAEASLLPLSAVEQRLRLVDKAVRLNPDNPDLLVIRANLLPYLGRNNDSVDDARRAAEIDPLSPGLRSNLIQSLAYSGQLSAAEEELRRAQQLWPASPTIDDARFRVQARYGNAREALDMFQSSEFRQSYMTPDMGPYLLARISPTEANAQRAIAAAQSPQLPEPRRVVQTIQLLGELGRTDQLYKFLIGLPPDKLREVSSTFYRPSLQKFRQGRRFMEILVRTGLVGFWRKSGKWPDFCFEPDLPYDCKTEAARLHA